MEDLVNWLLLAAVSLAATLSPGPAFLMTVRNSTIHGRTAGCVTALGLGLAEVTHILFVLAGLSAVITASVTVYSAIKYGGAAYLVYIGIKPLKGGVLATPLQEQVKAAALSHAGALRNGYLTNLLNPKSVVFYLAIFSQFIGPETKPATYALYALTIFVIEFGWFSVVAMMLTHPRLKEKFLAAAGLINNICGGLLIALGLSLALEKSV